MVDELLHARDGAAIRLRTLTAADGPAFAEHVRGDLDRLSKHLGWPARTTEPEAAAEWLAGYDRQEGGRIMIAGFWEEERLLGGVLLMSHDAPNANAELGCWIVAAGEGRGIVAAGCRVLIGRAIDLGVQRLVWQAATGNTRSRALAGRLSFVHEGTSRSDYVLRGGRLDTDRFSLVGDELRAALRSSAARTPASPRSPGAR